MTHRLQWPLLNLYSLLVMVPLNMGLNDNVWKFCDSVSMCPQIIWQSLGHKVILMYACWFSLIETDQPRIYCHLNVLLQEDTTFIFTASPFDARRMALLPTALCKSPQVWSLSEYRPNYDSAQSSWPMRTAATFHQNSLAFIVVFLNLDIIVMYVFFVCLFWNTVCVNLPWSLKNCRICKGNTLGLKTKKAHSFAH